MSYLNRISRNVPKKTYFLFALGTVALVGIISSLYVTPSSLFLKQELKEAPVLPLRRNLKGDTSKAVAMGNVSFTSDSINSSISKDVALTSSDAVSIETSCEDGKNVVLVATALGAAILGVVAAATGGVALPALGALLGASNVFTGLWSCPNYAIKSYQEFRGLTLGIISEVDAVGIAAEFHDIEEHLILCGDFATADKGECIERVRVRLEDLTTEARLDNVLYRVSRILTSASLEYSKVTLYKIIRAESGEIDDCKGLWVNKFFQEVDQVIERIEEGYKEQLKQKDHLKCEYVEWTVNGFQCRNKVCCTSEYKNGQFHMGESGINLCSAEKTGPFNPFFPWHLASCPDHDVPALKRRIQGDYPNSKAFAWWRAIQEELKTLKSIRDDTARQNVAQMCGIGICNPDEDECACVNNSMCGGGYNCKNNRCTTSTCLAPGARCDTCPMSTCAITKGRICDEKCCNKGNSAFCSRGGCDYFCV